MKQREVNGTHSVTESGWSTVDLLTAPQEETHLRGPPVVVGDWNWETEMAGNGKGGKLKPGLKIGKKQKPQEAKPRIQ